jgi:hypothetical protein
MLLFYSKKYISILDAKIVKNQFALFDAKEKDSLCLNSERSSCF